jgi:CubicO group peptidase (beta-lactamase class C family)
VSSAHDLFQWDEALRGDKVLGKQAKDKYFRADKPGYACGWQLGKAADGSAIIHHGGSTRGYRTELARYPKHDALVIVLTNEESDPRAIQRRLEEVLFGGDGKQPPK